MEDILRTTIEQAQAGDMSAFEQLYRQTSGFVYNVALRIAGDPAQAQEITQDVFLKIYRNLDRFEFRSSFKTWAYRICVNTALNACRSVWKEQRRRQDLDSIIDTDKAAVDPRKEQAHDEERQESSRRVAAFLERLNPDQRACIVLREIQGLRYDEIARVLNTNINTVRSRLKRARLALAAYAAGGR